MTAPLIDVRAHREFVSGHVPGAASIPLEELPDRAHELPTPSVQLCVMDDDPDRAARAAEILRTRGHFATIFSFNRAVLSETGDRYTRLWKPNEFLIEALTDLERSGSEVARALDVAD